MRLTIYSKPICHLCDEMKAVIHRVVAERGALADITIDEVDISADPSLLDRYGLDIPVLMVDGKKVAKYRITEVELRRILGSTLPRTRT